MLLTSGRSCPDVATLVVAWPPGWSVGERVPLHQDLNFPLLVLPLGHCWSPARHTRGAGRETAGPTRQGQARPAVTGGCPLQLQLSELVGAWADVAIAIASGKVRGLAAEDFVRSAQGSYGCDLCSRAHLSGAARSSVAVNIATSTRPWEETKRNSSMGQGQLAVRACSEQNQCKLQGGGCHVLSKSAQPCAMCGRTVARRVCANCLPAALACLGNEGDGVRPSHLVKGRRVSFHPSSRPGSRKGKRGSRSKAVKLNNAESTP